MTLDLAIETPANAAIERLRQLDDAAMDDVVVAAAQLVANDARSKAPVLSGTLLLVI